MKQYTHLKLNKFVLNGLAKVWSLEQISARMCKEKNFMLVMRACIDIFIVIKKKGYITSL